MFFLLAREGKKIREKIKKMASKVEEDSCSEDLEMVCFFIIMLKATLKDN